MRELKPCRKCDRMPTVKPSDFAKGYIEINYCNYGCTGNEFEATAAWNFEQKSARKHGGERT